MCSGGGQQQEQLFANQQHNHGHPALHHDDVYFDVGDDCNLGNDCNCVDALVGGMPILPSRLPEVTPNAFGPGDMLDAPGAVGANMPPLVRIKDKDGKTTKPVRQTGDSVRVRAGCKVGPPVQGKCWVCKKYMPAGKYTDTAFCCPRCKTPICKTMFDGRDHASCYAEHEHGAHPCKCTAAKKEGRFEERCKVAGAKKSA